MKAKWFLLAGLSAMMLGACSSDDDLTNNPVDKPTIEGEGIMNLNLQFVGSATTRIGGETPESGSKTESEVKDAYVYYFETSGDKFLGHSEATIISQTTQSGNVERVVEATVPANVVKTLQNTQNTANIIVVLNKPTTFTFGDTNTQAETDKTFNNFNAALEILGDNAGFMMSSSTYDHNTTDQTKEYTAFTSISRANIAKKGSNDKPTPVTVYVERVCSKVTLNVGNLKAKGNTPGNALVNLKNWGLNVKNKKIYPVKVLTDDFIQLSTNIWPGADDWDGSSDYRTYWAVDPNYENLNKDDFKLITFKDLKTPAGSSEYCLENTFNNDNQVRNQTTTAVIYAQYTPQFEGSTTIPGKHETWIAMNNRFYSLNTFVGNFLATQNIYKKVNEDGNDKYVSPVGTDVTFTYTPVYDKETTAENKQTIGGKDYKLAANTEKIYKFNGTDINKPKPEDFVEYKDNDWDTLNTEFAKYCKTAQIYINGYCYYEIPIRHFYDNEVRLDADAINSTSQLGRYGIVRNHSYQLTINKVLNPGKPIPGETITPEDKPDDDTPNYYMDVTINVLSWAVRNQGVEL